MHVIAQYKAVIAFPMIIEIEYSLERLFTALIVLILHQSANGELYHDCILCSIFHLCNTNKRP